MPDTTDKFLEKIEETKEQKDARIKREKLIKVIELAKQIYIQRCSAFNFLFAGGSQEQINEQRQKAALFFQGEANASFSIAEKFLTAQIAYQQSQNNVK